MIFATGLVLSLVSFFVLRVLLANSYPFGGHQPTKLERLADQFAVATFYLGVILMLVSLCILSVRWLP
jgi:hypothetical protein